MARLTTAASERRVLVGKGITSKKTDKSIQQRGGKKCIRRDLSRSIARWTLCTAYKPLPETRKNRSSRPEEKNKEGNNEFWVKSWDRQTRTGRKRETRGRKRRSFTQRSASPLKGGGGGESIFDSSETVLAGRKGWEIKGEKNREVGVYSWNNKDERPPDKKVEIRKMLRKGEGRGSYRRWHVGWT